MSLITDEKFKVDIREAVAEIMAAKEDAARVSTIEALLEDSQKTITELTETVTNKETESAALLEVVTNLKTKVKELEAKADEFRNALLEKKTETETLTERASIAEKELAAIVAKAELAARMVELEEAKVALSGDKRMAQTEKVLVMSEEEFASYKEERIELRAELEAELKEAAAVAAVNVVIPTTKREDDAAQAATLLNVERASVTMADKYLDFGKTLAANMRGDKE